MAAFDYDCPAIANGFIQETNRYINEVASRSLPYSPWNVNTPRGNWRRELGPIQNSVIFGRTVPTDTGDEWTDTISSDGSSTTACDYEPELVKFGQTTRAMRRQKRSIRTDDFCLEDLLDDMMIEQFLRGVGRNLTGVSQYVWATRRRREYSRLSEHKITEKGSVAHVDWSTNSFDGANPPTSKLLNGTLEQISDYLFIDGAFNGSIGMTGTGGKILTLITDANTSRELIRQDPQLREDFRFAYEGMGEKSPLLGAYGMGANGMGVSYNGFKHVRDLVRKFDIVGGEYVERFPYGSATAVTKGYDQLLDPRYVWASITESVIHVPSVYRELVQVPVSNPGDKFQFGLQNYNGDFDFYVIQDAKCNILKNKGFFFSRFVSASEPGETWFGVVIRHRSCLPNREPRTCSTYETYA